MKTIFTIIFFQFLALSLSAQSALDSKNGFRNYKIGADVSQYQNSLSFVATGINEYTKHYDVTENITVIGNPAKVDLVFYKNKLAGINVRFDYLTSVDYDEVLIALESLYGKARNLTYDSNKPQDLAGQTINGWNGKKVGMQFSLDRANKGVITIWGFDMVKSNYESSEF